MEIRVAARDNFTIVSLLGPLDYNTPALLEKDIKKLIRGRERNSLLLDATRLDFVGSSGIEQFLEILKKLFGPNAKCIGLKKEFQRCFKAFSGNGADFRIYTSIGEALAENNLDLNQIRNNEKPKTLSY